MRSFERPVAVARQLLVDVGGTQREQLAHAGSPDLLVVRQDLVPAPDLPLDRRLLADEQHGDAEDRTAEAHAEWRSPVLGAQLHDLVVQQLDRLGLHARARKAVDDDAGLILGLEQLAQQRLDDLAIADELTAILERAHARCVQQIADHDRRRGQPALAQDERRVGAFARAGGAAQPHDLLGKGHPLEPAFLDQLFPDTLEDQRRVFDLELGPRDAAGADLISSERVRRGLFVGHGLAG